MQPDINMNIYDNEGMVVIRFDKEVHEISVTYDVALQIAEEIARKAHAAHLEIEPPQDRSLVADRIRSKLITRITLVVNNLYKRRAKPEYVAAQVVDTVLSEIT